MRRGCAGPSATVPAGPLGEHRRGSAAAAGRLGSSSPAASSPSSWTITSTLASSPIWRSSAGVNRTCCGPRRISTCTSRTALAAQHVEHGVGDVGGGHLVGALGQHAGHVERDVAGADDGDARGGRASGSRSTRSGWPQYQLDERPRPERAGQVLPRHAEGAVDRAAGGVHDAWKCSRSTSSGTPARRPIRHAAEELHGRADPRPGRTGAAAPGSPTSSSRGRAPPRSGPARTGRGAGRARRR